MPRLVVLIEAEEKRGYGCCAASPIRTVLWYYTSDGLRVGEGVDPRTTTGVLIDAPCDACRDRFANGLPL